MSSLKISPYLEISTQLTDNKSLKDSYSNLKTVTEIWKKRSTYSNNDPIWESIENKISFYKLPESSNYSLKGWLLELYISLKPNEKIIFNRFISKKINWPPPPLLTSKNIHIYHRDPIKNSPCLDPVDLLFLSLLQTHDSFIKGNTLYKLCIQKERGVSHLQQHLLQRWFYKRIRFLSKNEIKNSALIKKLHKYIILALSRAKAHPNCHPKNYLKGVPIIHLKPSLPPVKSIKEINAHMASMQRKLKILDWLETGHSWIPNLLQHTQWKVSLFVLTAVSFQVLNTLELPLRITHKALNTLRIPLLHHIVYQALKSIHIFKEDLYRSCIWGIYGSTGLIIAKWSIARSIEQLEKKWLS